MSNLQKEGYRVYINNKLEIVVDTPEEVWEAIGRSPFGSLHSVGHTDPSVDISEFVPF